MDVGHSSVNRPSTPRSRRAGPSCGDVISTTITIASQGVLCFSATLGASCVTFADAPTNAEKYRLESTISGTAQRTHVSGSTPCCFVVYNFRLISQLKAAVDQCTADRQRIRDSNKVPLRRVAQTEHKDLYCTSIT